MSGYEPCLGSRSDADDEYMLPGPEAFHDKGSVPVGRRGLPYDYLDELPISGTDRKVHASIAYRLENGGMVLNEFVDHISLGIKIGHVRDRSEGAWRRPWQNR